MLVVVAEVEVYVSIDQADFAAVVAVVVVVGDKIPVKQTQDEQIVDGLTEVVEMFVLDTGLQSSWGDILWMANSRSKILIDFAVAY